MSYQRYFIGIDGGGTKTKVRFESDDGQIIGEGLSGPGNPAQSSDIAQASIIEASLKAVAHAGLAADVLSRTTACLGLAGVNIPKYNSIAKGWMLPFQHTQLTSDLHIACAGAHAGGDGAIIITGTGSSAFLSVDNQHQYFGGHGFPVGDKASGAWIGLRAISLTLEAMDGFIEKTDFIYAVCDFLKCTSTSDMVAEVLQYKSKGYAELAPLVIQYAQQGDPSASNIMEEGALYLNKLMENMRALSPARFSILGGLAPLWATWLTEHNQQCLSPSLSQPEYGVIALARQITKD